MYASTYTYTYLCVCIYIYMYTYFIIYNSHASNIDSCLFPRPVWHVAADMLILHVL